jgi:hypothetical protein
VYDTAPQNRDDSRLQSKNRKSDTMQTMLKSRAQVSPVAASRPAVCRDRDRAIARPVPIVPRARADWRGGCAASSSSGERAIEGKKGGGGQ